MNLLTLLVTPVFLFSAGLAFALPDSNNEPMKGYIGWKEPTLSELDSIRKDIIKNSQKHSGSLTPDERFVLRNDEIYDTKTNLTWKRCTEGMRWNGTACVGEPIPMYAQQSFKYNSPNNGWRLPTKEELASIRAGKMCDGDNTNYQSYSRECRLVSEEDMGILDVSPANPSGITRMAINFNVFQDVLNVLHAGKHIQYWSSSYSDVAETSWYVDFMWGDIPLYINNHRYVRLVKK